MAITGHRNDHKPADQIVRYDFVREANSWKIDDIKGSSDGEAWSIRKMLTDALKS
ncbi:protein-tyrosine-phosphatase [Bradyrhizobium sp. LB11.1]